jgi:hypothetical protein
MAQKFKPDVIPAFAYGGQLKENVTPWLDHGVQKYNLKY